MVKVWKDVDEVVKMIHELPTEELRKIEKEMVSVPNFDKSKKKEGKPRIK